jgi:maleate cis-trans isomerase
MVQRETKQIRLGFLYPGYAAEDDYPLLAMNAGQEIIVHVVHTSQDEDAHRVDALLDLGSLSRLLEGAKILRDQAVDAVVWACTSGSFVYGWEGARQQVEAIAQATGVPASSTPFAFVDATTALGISKVAVSATYPQGVSNYFREFLAAGGIEVVHMGSHDILTAAGAGTLGQAQVEEMIRRDDHPSAEAILLPDTALHSAAWLDRLEEVAGKRVLTANQVSFWKALRLAGDTRRYPGLGSLMRSGR